MAHQNKIRVAYAEDHELVRKAVIGFINGSGDVQVSIEAINGRDLLEKLEQASDVPDVCIIDINMPEMDGFDTIVELKRKWPKLKVLVVSVFDNEYYVIRMIVNGANGYLTKSCAPDELINAIHTVHEHEMYYSNHFTMQFVSAIKKNTVALPVITARELELLRLSCTDLTYTEIAEKIRVSPRSVEGFRENLFRKLNVKSRTGMAMFAVQFGFVTMEVKYPR